MKRIELLAPAGSPESLTAAVQNGADAVYLGFGSFHARRGAKGFSREEFEEGVSYCHLRGVKVYLTMNTLVTDRELPAAHEAAVFAAACGVDAILVQDLGLLRLLREAVPGVSLHASTQMTVHNLPGVLFCEALGISRVVLARELSRDAVSNICKSSPLEVETFLHGALCMGYSGQCFFSSLVGERSGNRGLCAQPCRLPYRWNGEGDTSYPLSLKDLSLAGHLGELSDMGVSCLKLEGRMKRPEYVAVVTKVYADALEEGREPSRKEENRLEAAFSRDGFTQGYFLDEKGPDMFGTRREGARAPEELLAEARESYQRGERPRVPIRMTAQIRAGFPVHFTVSDEDGHMVTLEGPVPEAARSRAIDAGRVVEQLSKTGGTPYLARVSVQEEAGLSLPLSAFNALRREGLAQLTELRTQRPERDIRPYTPPEPIPNRKAIPEITVSVLSLRQLSPALLDQGPALVYLPVEEIANQPDTVKALMDAYPRIGFALTLPRVCWDRELPDLDAQLRLCRDLGIEDALCGNGSLINLCQGLGLRLRGDFGLGVTNSLTLAELSRMGFSSATASFELNFSQIRDLQKPLDTELLAYGRLSMMLTEQCIVKNRGQGCHCEEGQVLTDRKGLSFPVLKAYGCRNEVYNAKTLFLADKKKDYAALGLWAIRLSFTTEHAEDCAKIMASYRNPGDFVPLDFTRGLYYRKVE